MKIYTIIVESICDYNEGPTMVKSFADITDAYEMFNRNKAEWREVLEDYGWEVHDDDEFCFSAGEEGYWCSNHVTIRMNVQDLDVSYHEHYRIARDLEREEFMVQLNEMPDDYWSDVDGAKVHQLPTDENGSTNCVVLADLCDGYIYVEVRRVIKTDARVRFAGVADGVEYEFGLSEVMPNYLQEVTGII